MWRARVAFVAALLALAGCRGADKTGDTKSPGVAGLFKKKDKEKDATPAKGLTWLDDVGRFPGAGTSIPKGSGASDPKNPKFDPKTAAQDALGGRVLDSDNRPVREDTFIRIDEIGAEPRGRAGFGINTKKDGYFFATGFEPGQTYELTVQATTTDGRKLVGAVQTKVPNPLLLIVLREDSSGRMKETDGGTFPPEPKPSDKLPPLGSTTKPPSAEGGWGPGGPTTGVPPASIGGSAPKTPAAGGIPPPSEDFTIPPPKPSKPENVADGQKDPFKSPPVSIPGSSGPPVPKLPALPPSMSSPSGGRSSMGTTTGGNAAGKLTLLDTLERPWDLDTVKPGTLVLVEFTTSTCVPCKQVIPIMTDLQRRYGANGLQVAAVLCDSTSQSQRIATAAKYSRDHHLNYTLYVEAGEVGSVRDRFDVDAYPHAVLLDSTGRVLWKGHPGRKNELEAAIKRSLGK